MGRNWNQSRHRRTSTKGKKFDAGNGKKEDKARSQRQEERWAKAGKVKERTLEVAKDQKTKQEAKQAAQEKELKDEAKRRDYEVEYAGATVRAKNPEK